MALLWLSHIHNVSLQVPPESNTIFDCFSYLPLPDVYVLWCGIQIFTTFTAAMADRSQCGCCVILQSLSK